MMSQATLVSSIGALAGTYLERFKKQTEDAVVDIDDSDSSRFLIRKVFGLTEEEGRLIEIYEKKAQFFYKYAGSFVETAALWCFRDKFPKSTSVRIRNTEGRIPRTFGNRPPRSPRQGEYLVKMGMNLFFLPARYRAGFSIAS